MRITDESFPDKNPRDFRPVAQRQNQGTSWLAKYRRLIAGILTSLVAAVAIFAASSAGLFGSQDVSSGVESNDEEIAELLGELGDNQVSQLLELEGSEPIVATVLDAELMRGEDASFYRDAQNGDKVIILNKKRLIILYRESEDRIINIASGTLAVTNP